MKLAFRIAGLEDNSYKMLTVGSSGARVVVVTANRADAALA
jgi:hypothetical protein